MALRAGKEGAGNTATAVTKDYFLFVWFSICDSASGNQISPCSLSTAKCSVKYNEVMIIMVDVPNAVLWYI